MSTAFDLTGRTALITGGGRGLGAGITRAMLDAGADVIVYGRRDLPQDLVDYASERSRRLDFYSVDIGDSDALASVSATVLAEHQVDILVNNAGTQERHPAVEFPLESFDRVMDVNLRSVFQLCQIFGAPMLKRGHGSIVNLASLLSFQGGLTVPAYAASKGAVAQLTKALCNEWSGKGVNVNAVAPGYMATEMNTALLADPVRLEQLSVRIPAGRWGEPEDIGNVVVFLASPASAYIHGQVLAVDGGWLAR
ncbi:SDR family oxidoreductase [Demequina oxidasica]|uniref:SDR family oxidoreductase n=1 Tax=Demequina oxidasica TaxID=676199 RepID=UPI000784179E|nr:SDR family oxidoreductase [Demequina oxidasica]